MSQVGHNVHNVTPGLLIMVKKAQLIDIQCSLIVQLRDHVGRLQSFTIGEDVYAFHTVGICDRFCEFLLRILHDHLPNTMFV